MTTSRMVVGTTVEEFFLGNLSFNAGHLLRMKVQVPVRGTRTVKAGIKMASIY